MDKKRILGIVLIIISVVIAISNLTLTGAIIGTSVLNHLNIIAIVFLVIGLVLFMSDLEKKVSKPHKIIRTREFEKSIKKHKSELKKINNTISKIGTGLANEEFLKHEKLWSIRTSHGGRVLYDRTPDKAILKVYTPPSKHY